MKKDVNWVNALTFMLAGFSTIPGVVHMAIYSDKQTLDHFDIWPWLTGGVLYIVGAVIYALKWPECWGNGKFDLIGNSHNIFHVFIVLAAMVHWYGSVRVFHER